MAERLTKSNTKKNTQEAEATTDQDQAQVEQSKTTNDQSETEAVELATAKAGKRSKKAIAEEAQKEAKEARKAQAKSADKTEAKKPKHIQNPKRVTKKRRASLDKIEASKLYSLSEGVKLLREVSNVKFDATCELHVNLGIDPRQADQLVRTSVVLPAGSGKKIRVAVIANDKLATAAKTAGADLVDAEDILSDIKKSKFDFDVLVATPDQMAALGKYAKVLGPKGTDAIT